jgi:tungstate transport system ATP-binding protein
VDAFVAAFVGIENLVPVTLWSAVTSEGILVGFGEASLKVGAAAPGMTIGAEGLLCVRPEDVVVTAAADGGGIPPGNRLQGRIAAVVPQGPFLKVTVDCGARITAALSGHAGRQFTTELGRPVTVALRPEDLYVIPRG